MDGQRFDAITRTLVREQSRRVLGRGLAGGLVALLVGGERVAADDTCKPVDKKCRKNAQCCSERCIDRKCAACIGFREACSSPEECCAPDQTSCAPITAVTGPVCCRRLGAACTSGGIGGDCCFVPVENGSDAPGCSPGGTCGGSGAPCRFNGQCVSGACTGGACT